MSITTLKQILPNLAFDGDKAGGACVIFKDGQCVLEYAFGQANANDDWSSRTLSVNFSIGKGVLATLVAVLVSAGILDYDKPIAHYWTDFGTNGKEQISLLDVLAHRANLFNICTVTDNFDDIKDWQTMLDKVAKMPQTLPKDQDKHGYVSAYSALVSGWIVGGVIEKAVGKPLQSVLDEYLAKPLGLVGQLYYGVPSQLYQSLALPENLWLDPYAKKKPTLKPDSQEVLDFYHHLPIAHLWGDDLTTQSINRHYFDSSQLNLTNYKNALLIDGKTPINYHAPDVVSVPIPAANGVSSAYALAVIYAMHAGGGVWQEQVLINQTTLGRMRQIQSQGLDAVMPAKMDWRAGFHRLFTVQNSPNAYGHMGYNGSVAFTDPDRGLSVAFIHNFDTTMLNDVRQFVVSELALMI